MFFLLYLFIIFFPYCSPFNKPNYNQLNVAVENLLNKNQYLARDLFSNVKAFEQAFGRELQALNSPSAIGDKFNRLESDFIRPKLESFGDLYLHKIFNSENAANPLGIDKIETVSVRLFSETVTDIDTLEFVGESYFLLIFTNSLALYSSASGNLPDYSSFINLEVTGLLSSKFVVYENEVFIATLTQGREFNIVDLYKWNSRVNKIEREETFSKVQVHSLSTKLFTFNIPILGKTLILILTNVELVIYSLDQSNGFLIMKRCDELTALPSSSIASFSINGQLYVGIADGRWRLSYLYKYNVKIMQFVHFQSFEAENATSIQYFRRGHQHYCLVSGNLYRWNGERFILKQRWKSPLIPPLVLSHVDFYGIDALILPQVLTWNRNKFFQSPNADILQSYIKPFTKWSSVTIWSQQYIITAKEQVITIYRVFVSRNSLSTKTERTEQKLKILREKLLKNEESMKKVEEYLAREKDFLDNLAQNPQDGKCKVLINKLNQINIQLSNYENKLKDNIAKRKDWTGLDLVTVDGKLIVEEASQIETVNHLNVSHFYEDSVRKNEKCEIIGKKTFLSKMTINDGCQVDTWNGGRIPDDYVFTSIPQEILAPWTILSDTRINKNLDIRRNLNNINFNQDVILLNQTRKQTIKGKMLFTNDLEVVQNVRISKRVNDFKISEITEKAFKKIVEDKKAFKKLIVKGNVVVNKVGGINLKKLADEAVLVNETTIPGHKIIKGNLHVRDLLNVEFINGFRFPDDFVTVDNQRETFVAAPKIFTNLVIDGHLQTDGLLSGVNLSEVITTKGDQRIYGEKVFKNIITGNIYVNGDKLAEYDELKVNGLFQMKETVNGVHLKQLFTDVVYKNSTTALVFPNSITFSERQSHLGHVEVAGTVNGMNLETDFVRLDNINSIYKRKLFHSPLTIDGNIRVNGLVSGVDIAELGDKLVKFYDQPEVITGVKSFVKGLTVRSLSIEKDEQSSKDESTVLPFSHRRLVVNRCVAKGDVYVRGTVNGQSFEEVAGTRVTLSTEQDLYSSLHLDSTSVVNNLFVNGKLNDYDINELWDDVLWKSSWRRQVVTGRKVFHGEMLAPVVHSRHGINGIHVKNVADRAIYVHRNRFIDRQLLVMDKVNIHGSNGLFVRGNINGYNFSNVFQDAVITSSLKNINIKGTKIFDSLNIKGSLWVQSTVNGLRINEDLLTTNTKQNISGDMILCNEVQANDEILIENLITKLIRNRESIRLSGNVTAKSLKSGNINGVNFTELWMDSVKCDEVNNVIGEKKFTGDVTFKKNLDVAMGINGIDYKEHFKHIVTSNGNWVITAEKKFRNDVFIKNQATFNSNLILSGVVNGVNSSQKTVYPNKISLDGQFQVHGDVQISKKLVAENGKTSINGDINLSSGWVNDDKYLQSLKDQKEESESYMYILNDKINAPVSNLNIVNLKNLKFKGKVTFLKGVNFTNFCPC